MKYLLLSLLVLSTTAISAEKMVAQASMKKAVTTKEVDVTPTTKEEEMADETALYTEKHSMKAQVTCKTKDGAVLKANDKGYEACIKKVKAQKHDPKAEVKVEFEKQ